MEQQFALDRQELEERKALDQQRLEAELASERARQQAEVERQLAGERLRLEAEMEKQRVDLEQQKSQERAQLEAQLEQLEKADRLGGKKTPKTPQHILRMMKHMAMDRLDDQGQTKSMFEGLTQTRLTAVLPYWHDEYRQ